MKISLSVLLKVHAKQLIVIIWYKNEPSSYSYLAIGTEIKRFVAIMIITVEFYSNVLMQSYLHSTTVTKAFVYCITKMLPNAKNPRLRAEKQITDIKTNNRYKNK